MEKITIQKSGVMFLWPEARPSCFLGRFTSVHAREQAMARFALVMRLATAPAPGGPVDRFLQAKGGLSIAELPDWTDLREIVTWTRADGTQAKVGQCLPAAVLMLRNIHGDVVGAEVISLAGDRAAHGKLAAVTMKIVDAIPGASIRVGEPRAGRLVVAVDLASAAKAAGRGDAPQGAATMITPYGTSIASMPIPAGVTNIEIPVPRHGDAVDFLGGVGAFAHRAMRRGVRVVGISEDQARWVRSSAYFTDAGPPFHVMPGHCFTACRAALA